MEACWAHNPEVDGSKPSAATFFFPFFSSFFFFLFFLFFPLIERKPIEKFRVIIIVPLIAQMVERRTVEEINADILRSLVRIRFEGILF